MNLVKSCSSGREYSNSLFLLSACVVICAILAMSGCFVSADSQPGGNGTLSEPVTDDLGQTITLITIPQRIVSLAPSNTEILFALGLDERIVGDTDYCNYPTAAENKSKIGGFSTVSVEKVMALKPDLVVASDGNNPDTITKIKELKVPVYYTDAKNMDDVLSTIERLGKLTGTSEKAKNLVNTLETREKAVEAKSEEMSYHPTVAHVIWYDPIYVSGKNTFQDELITLAGGVNVFDDKDGHQTASIEEFVSRNPDILLVNSGSGMGSNGSAIVDYFSSDKRLSELKAVKNGNVISVDSDIADRAGPRLWDLLETIAPKISMVQ